MFKNFFIAILFISFVNQSQSQAQFTPYDDLPEIEKMYKPAFDPAFTGWQKMLYDYPVNFYLIEKSYNSWKKEHPDEKSPIVRYYKIWKRAVEPYADTQGNIIFRNSNSDSVLKSSNLPQNLRQQEETAANSSNWEFIGPKETFWLNENGISAKKIDAGGNPKQCPWQANVYSFDVSASNSSVLYCGTETGFVNKTTDKGLTWSQVGLGYIFGGGITAVAIHPTNENIVYVSAGKQVHKSLDGGRSWFSVSQSGLFSAQRLKIGNNGATILAAADAGIFISNNEGQTWEKKSSYKTWDIEFKPDNPKIIYALSTSETGKFQVLISQNGGDNFQVDTSFPNIYPDASGGLLAVTPVNSKALWATLLSKEGSENVPYILKGIETDNKLTWNLIKKGEYSSTGGLGGFTNGQGYFDLVFEVSPTNENLMFWGTCTFWKSADDGKNFTPIGGYKGNFDIHPDIQDLKILSNGEMWVATDGGMNYSTDYFINTDNYSSRTKGIIGSDMWGFDQGWNEDLIVGGRYHNGNTAISESYNNKSLRMGGAESPTGWVIQGKERHVVFNDLGNGWILPKTAEGRPEGRFLFTKFPNMEEYGGRRSNLVHHPNYYGTIYVGEGSSFWKSTDMGQNFEMVYLFPNKIRYFQVSFKNPNVFYADVLGYGLYKSSDGGISWEQKTSLTSGTYGNSSWNGKLFFVISPTDENRIYACLQNGTWSADIGKIFKSNDGGNTWENWTGNISEYTKCMVIQPGKNGEDIVYLFTQSTNGSRSKVMKRMENESGWSAFDMGYPAGMDVNMALPFYRDSKIRVGGNAGVWESKMEDTTFVPLINPWVEKPQFGCTNDTLYFDDHSMLNHKGAAWKWNIVPQPAYISSATVRNPKVVVGKQGSYDVELVVTQNNKTYSKKIEKMVSVSECPSVNNCNNPAEIDKTLWKLISADSQETTGEDGKAVNAFDGNNETFWHTEWYSRTTNQPHEIQIDLGQEYRLSNFTYLPRQNSANGRIKDYELYLSNDKLNWGNPVYKGSFDNTTSPKKLNFTPTNGKYMKFRSLSEQGGNAWTTVAELSLTGCLAQNQTLNTLNPIADLIVYPIPASDKITVQLPFFADDEIRLFSVSDINGKNIKVGKTSVLLNEFSLDVKNLDTGIYFMTIRTKNGKSYKLKFIKD